MNSMPSLYDEALVGTWYKPRLTDFYNLGALSGVKPEGEKNSVLALNIDNQADFNIPGWALAVPGAVADATRYVGWGYRNVTKVSKYLSTKDKHKRKSIFHASWWMDAAGNQPNPFQEITLKDVIQGIWIPVENPAWSITYLELLEKGGKRTLRIWPDHCIEGTDGQALLPAIEEMISFQTGVWSTDSMQLEKGTVPEVEHYGAIEAEVVYPGKHNESATNYATLRFVNQFKKIYIAGQAKGHCVHDTIDQLLINTPEIAPKLYILTDCMSAIEGSEAETEREFERFAQLGAHLVTSQDMIA